MVALEAVEGVDAVVATDGVARVIAVVDDEMGGLGGSRGEGKLVWNFWK